MMYEVDGNVIRDEGGQEDTVICGCGFCDTDAKFAAAHVSTSECTDDFEALCAKAEEMAETWNLAEGGGA